MYVSAEALQALFLAEMASIDMFAAEREADGVLRVGPEDPDVRRILEAMAFFSARTRAAAQSATAAAVRRIAAGTLDDLVAPAPAAMMVECVAGPEVVESKALPGGTLLRAVSSEGKVGIFSTLLPIKILPISLADARLVEQRRRLFLRLGFSAKVPQKGALPISLYVRRLDDYRASLALHDALSRAHVRAFVRLGNEGTEIPCPIEFGAPSPRWIEGEADERGPLLRIRSFFHLPEQDLFVNVRIPALGEPWETLELWLELDPSFPTSLSISNDTFRLHVVPAENAWVDFAEPILWDGTRASAAVRSANALLEGVLPCGVRGVYKVGDKGLIPILPAALGKTGDSFEIDDEGETALRLSIGDAFENPVKILVDARWSQPELWSAPPGKLSISLQKRHLPGVQLRMVGALRAPAESPLAKDPARCLDVLSLRMRPALDRRGLVGMLEILGAGDDGPYRGFAQRVDELDSSEALDPALRTYGIRRVYRLALRQQSPEEAPLLRRLHAQIETLLDAWTEEPVKVEATARGLSAGTRALTAVERV